MIDQRLESALAAQLADWRAALANGAQRVGWKLGMRDRERIGGPVIRGVEGRLLVPVAPGDEVVADRGALGSARAQVR